MPRKSKVEKVVKSAITQVVVADKEPEQKAGKRLYSVNQYVELAVEKETLKILVDGYYNRTSDVLCRVAIVDLPKTVEKFLTQFTCLNSTAKHSRLYVIPQETLRQCHVEGKTSKAAKTKT